MCACACCVYVSECKLGGWSKGEMMLWRVGYIEVRGWDGAVEEQGEGGRGLRTTLLREDSGKRRN